MNAARSEIIAMIRDGQTNSAIARDLQCDRKRVREIRQALAVPNPPRYTLTLEQKWAALIRAADGGHLTWAGERASGSHTPVLRYREQSYSPASIAFRIHHGREAQGYVFAECGLTHCVAPAHVDDEITRAQTREQLRYLTGGQARKPACVHGHDLAIHGRYERDGRAYCHACKLARNTVAAA